MRLLKLALAMIVPAALVTTLAGCPEKTDAKPEPASATKAPAATAATAPAAAPAAPAKSGSGW